MNREQFLSYASTVYPGAKAVIKAVPPDQVQHRPRENMMSIAQVIRHMASACCGPFKHMLETEMPAPAEPMKPPPVEEYKGYDTVDEALAALEKDEQALREAVMALSEEDFQSKQIQLPWAPMKVPVCTLGVMCVEHLVNHRMQLFQYLKAMGEPVHTGTLYGM